MTIKSLKQTRIRRKYRARRKIFGTAERPRLAVYRSNKHMYAQIIDDSVGVTLASAGTMSKALKGQIANGGNKQAAAIIGDAIAKEAAKVGINKVAFDRSSYKYHGRVKELAEAARKAGLVF